MNKKDKEDVFNQVIDLIKQGNSLSAVFRDHKWPVHRTTFTSWLDDKDKANKYARACSIRADIMFEEILQIADKQGEDVIVKDGVEQVNHNVINRNRLQIDSRKWILAKMNPKKYGEKLDIDHSGELKIHSLKLIKASESNSGSNN